MGGLIAFAGVRLAESGKHAWPFQTIGRSESDILNNLDSQECDFRKDTTYVVSPKALNNCRTKLPQSASVS